MKEASLLLLDWANSFCADLYTCTPEVRPSKKVILLPVSHILIKEITECMSSNIKCCLLPNTILTCYVRIPSFNWLWAPIGSSTKGSQGGMHPLPPTRFSVLVKLLARKDMEVSVSHILNLWHIQVIFFFWKITFWKHPINNRRWKSG